jgi:hypothetical protein
MEAAPRRVEDEAALCRVEDEAALRRWVEEATPSGCRAVGLPRHGGGGGNDLGWGR